MTDVLVTGGVGFIGYHLSKLLLEKGYSVTILDNFSSYYSKELKLLNANELKEKGAIINEGSILNKKEILKSITTNCEIVYHLAAQPGVRYSTNNPVESFRVNVEGTSQVLSVCQEKEIRKTVVASSSSVFGLKKYLPIDELHPKNPISFYGVSKLAIEKMINVYQFLYSEMDISIIRPFTVIGPRQRPDMAINAFVSSALEGKPITIFGNGEQTRDWTHVDNIAEAIYLISIKSKARNEDFNVGSGISTSVNDVLNTVSKIIGKTLQINYSAFDNADVKDTLTDIKKAKKILGYSPKKSLETAIKEFINDYKDNLSKNI